MQLTPHRPSILAGLPSGSPGVAATLAAMSRLVNAYKASPLLRDEALSLLMSVPSKQWMKEIAAIFECVRNRIRYTRDIIGVETLQTPLATLDIGAGDCDDMSTLLATMLASVGYVTRFVAVGFSAPGDYSHVYVEVAIPSLPGAWMALDATMAHPMGWAPPNPKARMVQPN